MINSMSRRAAAAGAILFLLCGTSWPQEPPQAVEFQVFDALMYRNKPNLAPYGIRLLRGMNQLQSSNDPSYPVDIAKTHDSMRSLKGYSGIVYLDYESWPLTDASPQVIAESVRKYILVADIAREEAPTARFGYYGLVPCREYWGLVNHDASKIKAWKECSRLGEAVADHVDVIFPSLYTFYNDQASWDVYAKGMIAEARRYKKPVYAFLWPEFHPSNPLLKGTNIPAQFWRHQLELCRSLSDGIVIWGGWQEQWQENAAWWVQTKEFMSTVERRH